MTAQYPSATPTLIDLLDPRNNILIVTTAAIDAVVTTIPILDTSNLPVSGFVTFVDGTNEIIFYTSKNATELLGVTRGADGSSAQVHADATNLEMRWNANYHVRQNEEIIAIGTDLRNAFTVEPDDSVAAAGVANSIEDRLDMYASRFKDIISDGDWKDTPTRTLNAVEADVLTRVLKGGDTMTGNLVMATNLVNVRWTDSGANTVSIAAPGTISTTYGMDWPTAQGAANSVFINDGGGLLSFGLIANANVDGAAAIAYSKLNLTGQILNADVNASAAIAYSKLNLTGNIINGDINGSAGIVFSKMAALTINRLVSSNGSGFVVANGWGISSDDITGPGGASLAFTGSVSGTFTQSAAATTTPYSVVWPAAQSAGANFLKNNGSGVLTWESPAGSGTVNPGTINQIAYYAAAGDAISGTSTIIIDNSNQQARFADGTLLLPAQSWQSDENTGWRHVASGNDEWVQNGLARVIRFGSSVTDMLILRHDGFDEACNLEIQAIGNTPGGGGPGPDTLATEAKLTFFSRSLTIDGSVIFSKKAEGFSGSTAAGIALTNSFLITNGGDNIRRWIWTMGTASTNEGIYFEGDDGSGDAVVMRLSAAQQLMKDGTVAVPTRSWLTDTDTGWRHVSSGFDEWVQNGVVRKVQFGVSTTILLGVFKDSLNESAAIQITSSGGGSQTAQKSQLTFRGPSNSIDGTVFFAKNAEGFAGTSGGGNALSGAFFIGIGGDNIRRWIWQMGNTSANEGIYFEGNPGAGNQVAFFIAPSAITTRAIITFTNGVNDIGDSTNRYKEIFATNGTINTSHSSQKTDIKPIENWVVPQGRMFRKDNAVGGFTSRYFIGYVNDPLPKEARSYDEKTGKYSEIDNYESAVTGMLCEGFHRHDNRIEELEKELKKLKEAA